MIWNIVIVT